MSRRRFVSALLFVCCVLAAPSRAETVLYDKPSAYSTIIVTEDASGVRTLRFEKNGARQSVVRPGDPDYLALPYTKAALVGLALSPQPRRILVVGLGGGTLPMFLHKHYPQATIDAVDIDPDVVSVAKKFFGFREDDLLRAHVGDGRRFVERVREPYDVVFLDAFGLDSVPPHLATQEFLLAVKRAIKPSGVVIGNVWGRHSSPLYDSMVRTYQAAFDDLYVLEVQGADNKLLFGLPRRQPLTPAELEALADKVATANGFGFDLGALVQFGLEHAREKNPAGRVLRDKVPVPSR